MGWNVYVALFTFINKTKMPIPTPKDKEKRVDYIARCMGDDTMNSEYPETGQRFAVCASKWKESLKG